MLCSIQLLLSFFFYNWELIKIIENNVWIQHNDWYCAPPLNFHYLLPHTLLREAIWARSWIDNLHWVIFWYFPKIYNWQPSCAIKRRPIKINQLFQLWLVVKSPLENIKVNNGTQINTHHGLNLNDDTNYSIGKHMCLKLFKFEYYIIVW